MTSSWGVALAASAILAIAGCHPAPKKAASSAQPPGSLCELVSYEDVTRALGAPPVGSTDTADAGNFNPGCSWMAQAAGGKPPHIMVFTVWKKTALVRQGSALTGRELYAHYVSDLSSLYTTIEPAYGVGDEATLGFNATSGVGFDGKIIARKGDDVLTMQLTGADRATFEAVARRVTKAM